jgi:hypothetical protein
MKRLLVSLCLFLAVSALPASAQEGAVQEQTPPEQAPPEQAAAPPQGGIGISASAVSNYALKEAVPGNADGKANPGETLYLDIGVKNSSPEPVYGLEAVISGSNTNALEQVVLYKARETLGDLEAGAEASLTGSGSSPKRKTLMIPDSQTRAFRFSVGERCPPGPLVFTVLFRDSGGREWTDTLSIPVVPNEGEMSIVLPPAGGGGESGLSRLFFSMSPKLLENGSMTDIALGYDYNDFWTSELRFRFTKESWYEPLDEEFESSLKAVDDSNYEFFLLPAEYFFRRDLAADLWAGAGAYYNYHPLKEEGYFNWPDLELLLGKSPVNAYANDFSMHVIGPLISGGISYRWDKVRFSASAGVVPVYFYQANQKVGMDPLMEPESFEYSQRKMGSPYIFGDLSVLLFNILSLSAYYDFTSMNYDVIDFTLNDDLEFVWQTPEASVLSHTVKFEAALNIPLGGFVIQIGYGRFLVSTQVNSDDPVLTDKQYFLINGQWKKIR